jgi:hypothetical protein
MSGRRARASRATLSPAWRSWLVENLLRGARPEDLLRALVSQGVPVREARLRVEQAADGPALAIAREKDRRARQLESVLRLHREAARSVARPGVIERVEAPSAEVFFNRYYATLTPVVLTGLVPRWPAFGLWSPAHFRAAYGHVEVEMSDGREGDPDHELRRERHARPTRMDAFVDRVLSAGESNDFYLIARNYNTRRPELAPLMDQIDWSCGYFDRAIAPESSALWFGPAGTVTPLHHDSSSILFAQVYGRKKLLLASPAETALLDGVRAMYAAVDPEHPERAERPSHRGVLFSEVILEAGEALFIPAGWWHHVRALTVSISVALNGFARPNPFAWYQPGSL